MRTTMLNTPTDLVWLKDTALKGVVLPERWAAFKAAVLHGSEDAPASLDLFVTANPLVTDSHYRVHLDVQPAEFCVGQLVIPHTKGVYPETLEILRRG